MTTIPLRFIAALALGGQLLPLGPPLLCDSASAVSAAGCDQAMPLGSGGGSIAAPTDQSSCANSVFCAVTPTAVAGVSAVALAPSAVHRTAPPVAPPLDAGDPLPPLSPPPQA